MFLALHERYRITDDRTPNEGAIDLFLKKRWHMYKGGVQLTIMGMFYVIDHSFITPLLFASFFTLFHDAYINVTVLQKPVDYVGSTASLDKLLFKIFRSYRNIFLFKIVVFLVVVFFYVKRYL